MELSPRIPHNKTPDVRELLEYYNSPSLQEYLTVNEPVKIYDLKDFVNIPYQYDIKNPYNTKPQDPSLPKIPDNLINIADLEKITNLNDNLIFFSNLKKGLLTTLISSRFSDTGEKQKWRKLFTIILMDLQRHDKITEEPCEREFNTTLPSPSKEQDIEICDYFYQYLFKKNLIKLTKDELANLDIFKHLKKINPKRINTVNSTSLFCSLSSLSKSLGNSSNKISSLGNSAANNSPGSNSRGSNSRGRNSVGNSLGSNSLGSNLAGNNSRGRNSRGRNSTGNNSRGSNSRGSNSAANNSRGSNSVGNSSGNSVGNLSGNNSSGNSVGNLSGNNSSGYSSGSNLLSNWGDIINLLNLEILEYILNLNCLIGDIENEKIIFNKKYYDNLICEDNEIIKFLKKHFNIEDAELKKLLEEYIINMFNKIYYLFYLLLYFNQTSALIPASFMNNTFLKFMSITTKSEKKLTFIEHSKKRIVYIQKMIFGCCNQNPEKIISFGYFMIYINFDPTNIENGFHFTQNTYINFSIDEYLKHIIDRKNYIFIKNNFNTQEQVKLDTNGSFLNSLSGKIDKPAVLDVKISDFNTGIPPEEYVYNNDMYLIHIDTPLKERFIRLVGMDKLGLLYSLSAIDKKIQMAYLKKINFLISFEYDIYTHKYVVLLKFFGENIYEIIEITKEDLASILGPLDDIEKSLSKKFINLHIFILNSPTKIFSTGTYTIEELNQLSINISRLIQYGKYDRMGKFEANEKLSTFSPYILLTNNTNLEIYLLRLLLLMNYLLNKQMFIPIFFIKQLKEFLIMKNKKFSTNIEAILDKYSQLKALSFFEYKNSSSQNSANSNNSNQEYLQYIEHLKSPKSPNNTDFTFVGHLNALNPSNLEKLSSQRARRLNNTGSAGSAGAAEAFSSNSQVGGFSKKHSQKQTLKNKKTLKKTNLKNKKTLKKTNLKIKKNKKNKNF